MIKRQNKVKKVKKLISEFTGASLQLPLFRRKFLKNYCVLIIMKIQMKIEWELMLDKLIKLPVLEMHIILN